jgi:hypothetical protein
VRGWVFGISTSQFISIILFALGLALMIYHWRRGPANESSDKLRAEPDTESTPEAGSASLTSGAVGSHESEAATNP